MAILLSFTQIGHDDRSQSGSRSRCQVSSTTASGGGKKHKGGKVEEGKPLSTFENLFGPPIQNLPPKHSPAMNSAESHKTQVNNIEEEFSVNFEYSNVQRFISNRSQRLKIVHLRKLTKRKRTKVNRVAPKM